MKQRRKDMRHMAYRSGWMLGTACCLLASGCRTAARIAEVPRVDLEVSSSGGNRGYLVGVPPEEARVKTTRQMVRADIEIPSFYTPRPGTARVTIDQWAPPEIEHDEPAAMVPPAMSYDTYIVQKGESLWSVASRPEIYGQGNQWRRILDANEDVLKGNPNRVRAGMTLRITRSAVEPSADVVRERVDEGTTFKK
jgi:hypothetical protein